MSNDTSINANLEEAFKTSDWSSICAALLPHFNDYLARRSKNVFECERVASLDHIATVPALYDDQAGTRKQVIVPMKVFTQEIDAQLIEAVKATNAANNAANSANAAAKKATDATADLETKKQQVDAAVKNSETQTAAAKKATEDTLASKTAIEKNEDARKSAETARASAESARVTAEKSRASAENTRNSNETTRQKQETTRQSQETTRNNNETTRQKQETTRQSQEAGRVDAEKKRVTAEIGRASSETTRQAQELKRETNTSAAIKKSDEQTAIAKEMNDHPPKMGENGNWWTWDITRHEYVDTGVIARGGAMYPTFRQRRNKLLMQDYGSHVAEHVVKRRNKLIIKV